MASFTLSVAPWPVGTVVPVYYAEGWTQPGQAPSGAAITTGTVTSANTVEFSGLTEKRRYVAYALGQGVRFTAPTASGVQEGTIADRQRINDLEEAVVGGSGTFVITWDAVTGWPSRPDTSTPGIWQDLTGNASDPTELMADGDMFVGNAP